MSINNIPFFYQVEKGALSIDRLRFALRHVVLKHSSLRTSFFFDSTIDCLMQRIIKPEDGKEELFAFTESTLKMDADWKSVMYNKLYNFSNLNLSIGCVFSVHIFKHESDNENLLQTGDIVVFNFHQSVFDILSLNMFCRDLSMAYESETALLCNDNELHYIDCKLKRYFFLLFLYLIN